MPRISELSSLTVPADDDLLAIVDTSGAITARITRGDFLTGSDLPDDTVTTDAIQDDAVTADKMDLPYSTTEHLTGRTWIDGKPEYEKTVSYDSSTGTAHNYTHGISIDTPISCSIILGAGTANITTPPIVPSDMLFSVSAFLTRTAISIRRGTSAVNGQVIVTIRYTKV